jgi:hypothetical protein
MASNWTYVQYNQTRTWPRCFNFPTSFGKVEATLKVFNEVTLPVINPELKEKKYSTKLQLSIWKLVGLARYNYHAKYGSGSVR